MRTTLAGIAAVAALIATPALAADMGMPLKAPPAPLPAASWTGCYLDAGFGYGLWNQDHSVSFGPAAGGGSTVQSTDGGRGWLGRFGGGCDYQLGGAGLSNWVIGAFADYDVMDLTGTISTNEILAGTALEASQKEEGAWYAGGRIGYLVNPNFLAFTSGGWTETRFGSLSENFTSTGLPSGFGYAAHTYSGWFLGGGYEYALNFAWLPIHGLYWKTEYRFAQYGSASLPELALPAGTPDGNVLRSTPYVQTITSSLVWRFNFGGPIATRY